MKDNKLVKFTLFVLLITLVALALVSGTFAKYTTTVTGSDSAVVAKWSIKVNGDEMATVDGEGNLNDTVTFNLFETAETNVATDKLAPGTSGEFDLNIKNESEVNATYSIDFTVTESTDIPVKYSVDGGQNWTDDLEDVASTALAMGAESTPLTVQWKWDFAGDDTVDTKLGIAAQTTATAPTVTVTAVVNAVQVD